MRSAFRLFGVALFLALVAAPRMQAQDVGIAIGSTPVAPTLEDLEGQPVDLSKYVGKKPVLLEFWATWCPLCKQLEPSLHAAKKKYGATLEVLIVAVGVNQSTRSIKRHLADHPMPGLVLWDGQGKAVRAFEAPSTSYVVVLDAKGRVVYTGTGAEQKLEPVVAKAIAAK
jgi:thiol-disulfide isomerase/thioredoxin